jgi:hypothetical protein
MMVECSCLFEDAPMVMQYTNYETLVCKLGVKLVGWTEPKIGNPGKLMTALSLNRLLNALRKGDCHWVKLTRVALTDKIDAQDAKMLAGKGKKRATRNDKGTSKKHKRGDRNGDGKYKSTENVADISNDDG